MSARPSPSVAILAEDRSLADRVRKNLLANDFHVVAATALSKRALSKLVERGGISADVVIVVGSLEARDGTLLGELQRFDRPVVFCSDLVSTLTLRWALDRGVDGIVWNSDLEENLVPAIRTVWTGQLVFPPQLRRQSKALDLTNREKQVLSLIIMGLTNREIAKTLFVSENTVKSHLNTAYRKLGVESRVEAAELITNSQEGLGTGILAITPSGHRRGRGTKS